jgi:hypothetical protein
MRKELVLNDADKKVRFNGLIQRRRDAKENFQQMPVLKPIVFGIDADLRLSGLGFLMNEVFSGKYKTLKEKNTFKF